MSWRRSGNVRTSKSWTVRFASGMPSSAVASRTSRASVSGANPGGQRPRRDRERDVADVGAALDEARHRPAAAELAVVGVRGEHEHALPGLDHAVTFSFGSDGSSAAGAGSGSRRSGKRAQRPVSASSPQNIGSSNRAL